ncbi:MAG: hypothetical protein Q7S18_01155 [bacterium]|nr:hypothetical protein [bacterium]
MKKFHLIFSIFLFAILSQAGFAFPANAQNAQLKIIPRIDNEAASTEKINRNSVDINRDLVVNNGNRKDIYPMNFWVFLFGAYVFILIFNLSFDFEKTQKMRLFWEIGYTFLAIFVWDKLDLAKENPWFPRIVIETFAIVYALYYYFFKKIFTRLTARLT